MARHKDIASDTKAAKADTRIRLWANEYRRLAGVPMFFEAYFKFLESSSQLPGQSFLIGSGLLREDEVSWCRVLWWLLCPENGTGAMSFQKALLRRAQVRSNASRLEVHREEHNPYEGQRTDIVLRTSKEPVLVLEAKVNAAVRVQQLSGYRQTYRCTVMLLSVERSDEPELHDWPQLTWIELAEDLREVRENLEDESGLWSIVAQDFARFLSSHYHRNGVA